MPDTSVDTRIKDFLLAHFPATRGRTLSAEEPLLENGILDSLGVLDLVAYLEREFAISVLDEDLLPEHFATLNQLTTFIELKRARNT